MGSAEEAFRGSRAAPGVPLRLAIGPGFPGCARRDRSVGHHPWSESHGACLGVSGGRDQEDNGMKERYSYDCSRQR